MAISASMDTAIMDLGLIMKINYRQGVLAVFFSLFAPLKIFQLAIKGLKQNFDMSSINRLLLVFILLTLSGCGIAYHASHIQDNSLNIQIINLTPQTISEANSSPYEPQRLPLIFSSSDERTFRTKKNNTLTNPILGPNKYSGVIKTSFPEPSQPIPYIIGVGDVVMLSTPGAENVVEALNSLIASQNKRQGYTVQSDGAISIPDIGRVILGGLTLNEAEDAVFQKLIEAAVVPSFSIEIAEFNSQSVSVVGSVLSPGIEPITLQPLYLGEVISRKGGITIDNAFVFIRLYRNGSIYQFSVSELYNQDRFFNFLLKDGDRIVVQTTEEYNNNIGLRQTARFLAVQENELIMEAQANSSMSIQLKLQYGAIPREYVYIIGEVGMQSRFTLPFEDKAVLADALLDSKGILPLSGNPKQIYVIRTIENQKDSTSISALHLDATNAANFVFATLLELRPKDIVFVGTQPITNWNRMINQILPSLQLSKK